MAEEKDSPEVTPPEVSTPPEAPAVTEPAVATGPTEQEYKTMKGRVTTLDKQLRESGVKANEAHQRALEAEAKAERLEAELQQSGKSAEELAEIKTKLETAVASNAELETKTLDARKAFIVTTYKISPEAIKEKTLSELDNFEEALKAVTTGGSGNYATGGGGSSVDLQGLSPMELARRAYDKPK